ncbi:histidine phosphatase family protein, partial [Falsiroseomonas sp.]|uniref:histidine phosphatase family protein n=1 Tax=Falsiroseomonas sp. TaxID=2870721 RepID=UPI00271A2532
LTGARPHGGETVAELAVRVAAALTDARSGPVPVLVVCHAGVIKAALVAGQGEAAWQARHDFGSWLELSAADHHGDVA